MMTLKEKQFLVISLKQMLKDDKDTIIDAYAEEYAPEQVEKGKVNLGQLLDMAACLMYDWSGNPDFDEIVDDFKL